ncbi:MAG: hypothetical protein AABZ17_05520, partial [Nitrospirota bacterium]
DDLRFTKPLLYQLSYAGSHVKHHNLHGFFLSLKGFFAPPRMTETNRLQALVLLLVSPTTATMAAT